MVGDIHRALANHILGLDHLEDVEAHRGTTKLFEVMRDLPRVMEAAHDERLLAPNRHLKGSRFEFMDLVVFAPGAFGGNANAGLAGRNNIRGLLNGLHRFKGILAVDREISGIRHPRTGDGDREILGFGDADERIPAEAGNDDELVEIAEMVVDDDEGAFPSL